MEKPLIEIVNLKKYFKTPKGMLHAVDNVNLSIPKGKTLGIVGESGCGKSTLGRVLLRLIDATEGQVLYKGEDILKYSPGEVKKMRRKMQMIFQDPYASINPRMTVSEIIGEPLIINKIYRDRRQVQERVEELMEIVGLAQRLINTYPHELDGGRRQRIGVARALSVNPEFIVCDEPVSALDVSIQAQVLNLFNRLQRQHNLTYIFISHDLGVIKHVSDRIAIMYLGRVVELCRAAQIYENPLHPYTKALLSAIPPESPFQKKERIVLKGEIPSPIGDQVGCPLAGRCPNCTERCTREIPTLQDIGDGHQVACFLYH